MSVKLGKLNRHEEKRTVAILFGSDTLNIVYNRSKYTPKFEREIKEMMDANLPAGSLAKMVFALVLDWDLVDDVQTPENLALPEDQRKTEPVPLTEEVFDSLLSVDALTTLVEKLAEDNRPNPKTSDFTSDI